MTGLLTKKGSYAVDSLLASEQIELKSVDLTELTDFNYICPYKLPKIKSGKFVIVVSGFLHEINNFGISSEELIYFLRPRFEKIFLLDQADPFQLDFAENILCLFDRVLKVNGKFKDTELYNYKVGAITSNGDWTNKNNLKDLQYNQNVLGNIHLSIPCFLGTIPKLRRRVRKYYQSESLKRFLINSVEHIESFLPQKMSISSPPSFTVHFYGSLTHIQRADAVEKMQNSKIKYLGGITSIPPYITAYKGLGISEKLNENERKNIADKLSELMVSPLNRYSYQQSMQKCKAVLSITGYGELCFRMAEAWKNRRILICQDLSHVNTLFPFENGRNVVYCRPDLSDLTEILSGIEDNFQDYIHIAEQGYEDWLTLEKNIHEKIREGFLPIFDNNG